MDPRLHDWLMLEPKLKPRPGTIFLSPFHAIHKNAIKCPSNPKEYNPCFTFLSCHFRGTCSYLPWFWYKTKCRIFNSLKTKISVLKPLLTTLLMIVFLIVSKETLKVTSSSLFLKKVRQTSHLPNILFRCWRHRCCGGICTKFPCVCGLPLPTRCVWKGDVDDLLRDW